MCCHRRSTFKADLMPVVRNRQSTGDGLRPDIFGAGRVYLSKTSRTGKAGSVVALKSVEIIPRYQVQLTAH